MLAATRTIAAARHALAEKFRQAGIDSAETDARLLMAHALGIDRAELIANGERALNLDETKAIDALGERRLKREPIARIFGRKEFWSLSLQVSPAVLVPRPETETVVEAALDAVLRDALQMEKLRILDIGTGSGALLLALLSELPNAVGIGTDISAAALQVARANAERNDLAGRCYLRRLRYRRGPTGSVRSHRLEPALCGARRHRHRSRRRCATTTRRLRSTAAPTAWMVTAPSPRKPAACWRRAVN